MARSASVRSAGRDKRSVAVGSPALVAHRLPHRVRVRCERLVEQVGRLDEEDAFIDVGGRHGPLLLLATLPGDQMAADDDQRHRPVDDADRRRPAYGCDERQAGPVAAGTPRRCLGRTDTCHAVVGSALTRLVPALSARMTCLPFADHSLRGACPGPVGPRGRSPMSKVLRGPGPGPVWASRSRHCPVGTRLA